MLLAGPRELASLFVHHFQAVQSLCRIEFELLADQAVIDCGLSRACRYEQLKPSRSKRVIERGHAGVRVGALESSNGRLADREPLCQIGLREPGAPPGICKQLAGERRGWGWAGGCLGDGTDYS
jgi:hypothetical protein